MNQQERDRADELDRDLKAIKLQLLDTEEENKHLESETSQVGGLLQKLGINLKLVIYLFISSYLTRVAPSVVNELFYLGALLNGINSFYRPQKVSNYFYTFFDQPVTDQGNVSDRDGKIRVRLKKEFYNHRGL